MTTTDQPSFLRQLRLWLGVGTPPAAPDRVQALDLGATERVVWSRSLASIWPLALAAGLAVWGVIMLFVALPTGIILIAVSMLILAFARINVMVDPNGLRVRFGLLPWPTKRVRIDNIERAAAIELLPIEWGGWGYRIAAPAKGFKRSAVVLRKGEAIHLTLKNQREFAVTVDDATEAAALINAYVERG